MKASIRHSSIKVSAALRVTGLLNYIFQDLS